MEITKLEMCINKTRDALEKLEVVDERGESLVRFARDYYDDALHYREKDPETALEAVSYAHGFIDSGILLGLIKIKDYHLSKQRKS